VTAVGDLMLALNAHIRRDNPDSGRRADRGRPARPRRDARRIRQARPQARQRRAQRCDGPHARAARATLRPDHRMIAPSASGRCWTATGCTRSSRPGAKSPGATPLGESHNSRQLRRRMMRPAGEPCPRSTLCLRAGGREPELLHPRGSLVSAAWEWPGDPNALLADPHPPARSSGGRTVTPQSIPAARGDVDTKQSAQAMTGRSKRNRDGSN